MFAKVDYFAYGIGVFLIATGFVRCIEQNQLGSSLNIDTALFLSFGVSAVNAGWLTSDQPMNALLPSISMLFMGYIFVRQRTDNFKFLIGLFGLLLGIRYGLRLFNILEPDV